MPGSAWSEEVQRICSEAEASKSVRVKVGDKIRTVRKPFASPEDWRDHCIYFLLVDRFNREPQAAPQHLPYDGEFGEFQGGNLEGIRQKLDYLKSLGAGAIWMSPVIKNCLYDPGTYHGYGFQDFLGIDPRFASDPVAAKRDPTIVDRELQQLIDEAHARDIYVIFDIVLNHAGNVFEYDGFGATAPYRNNEYAIHWHDAGGQPVFPSLELVTNLDRDAGVWPVELQHNSMFRRKGKGGEGGGDFESLKELVTDFSRQTPFGLLKTVRKDLIRAYQYLIAKFDVDGFRVDTLKFIEPEFARTFGNAMREFALGIGKKNFFTFGEVFDDERKIAQFIGKNAGATEDPIGVDAALDFPLFFRLPGVVKGFSPPADLLGMYQERKRVQRNRISSHGEASGYFVTFLDNHDMKERFYFRDENGRYDDQVTVALGLLFTLPGIPCIYYGTEQGLHGRGNKDLSVREALWGKENAFNQNHPFYRSIRSLNNVRGSQPALRYGRMYFRQVSGNGVDFGISACRPGVVAFSRILNDIEILVVANTNLDGAFDGEVVVDAFLHADNAPCGLLFSNKDRPQPPAATASHAAGSVMILEPEGGTAPGPVRTVKVQLKHAEIQIFRIH